MLRRVFLLWLLMPGLALAQAVAVGNPEYIPSITVAIYQTTATNPNSDSPVGTPVTYTAFSCRRTLGSESLTDPTVGFFEWPVDSGEECSFSMAAQIGALSAGSYKGALKIGSGLYLDFSSTFTVN